MSPLAVQAARTAGRRAAPRGGLLGLSLVLSIGAGPSLASADDPDEDGNPPGPAVPVIVSSPRPVILSERVQGSQVPQKWPIPATPAGGAGVPLTLHQHSELEISGPGVSTAQFELLRLTAPLRLQVSPGSRRLSILGSVLGIGLAMFVPIGAIGLGFGLSGSRTDNQVGPPGWLSQNSQIAIWGGISLGLGIAGEIVGWTLYSVSATKVQQSAQ